MTPANNAEIQFDTNAPDRLGEIVHGIVRKVTVYGAFVDIGEKQNALLHIAQVAWDPLEHFSVGQKITSKVIGYSVEKNRFFLGTRQLADDPWDGFARRAPQGSRMFGKVFMVVEYGAFVEVGAGIRGLVHKSELSWSTQTVNPFAIVQPDDAVEVVVLEVDEINRQLSLSLKQCRSNPWVEFSRQMSHGSRLPGKITRIAEEGVFVEVAPEIEGLVPRREVTWARSEWPPAGVAAGDLVDVVVLKLRAKLARYELTLSLKRCMADPWKGAAARYRIGMRLSGKVAMVIEYGAFVDIEPGVSGLVHKSEMDWNHETIAPSTVVRLGDTVEVEVIQIDEAERRLELSMKRCADDPFVAFSHRCPPGTRMTGTVVGFIPAGLFVQVEPGIDGFVHRSEIDWSDSLPVPQKSFKRGDRVEVIVLRVDLSQRRVALSVRQCLDDPRTIEFSTWTPEISQWYLETGRAYKEGDKVRCVIKSISNLGAVVTLPVGRTGFVRISDMSWTLHGRAVLKRYRKGDEIDAIVLGIDPAQMRITLGAKQVLPRLQSA